jgi:NADH-quinone oxidoreductase subunit E
MDKTSDTIVPKELASAANLMVHPLAGAAALSALGVGLASQTFGVWMGALTGMVEVSQRLLQPDDTAGGSDSTSKPAKKAEPATAKADETRTLIEKTKALAAAKAPKAPAEKPSTKAVAAKVVPIAPAAVPAEASSAQVAAQIMPEDFRQPKAAARPAMPDDLKAISGIGPKVEQVLNGFGIWTYAQIAGWTAEEIAWVEDTLGFKGRIGRGGWLAQAAALDRARTRQ